MARDDPWADFPVSKSDTPADPWEAFPVAAGQRKRKPDPAPAAPSFEGAAITGAVDGDTVRAAGRAVRVYGVDAPELAQQGLNALGQSVPIGEQSRDTLMDMITNNDLAVGSPVGESYGRTVAPLTDGRLDVGHDLARHGNALAAPEYLATDPARRFDYLQAERLARQNGLGIHATRFQPPVEHRASPIPVDQLTPERSSTAMFWDTPTPFAGMRPEVEQTFVQMLNDRSIAPDAVAAYARDNGGFVVDPEQVAEKRARADQSGAAIAMNYADAPKVLTDNGDGAAGAAVRGIGNGVLPNWLEETGAVVDALGATPGRENIWNSDRRLADVWANNAGQNEAITGYDKFAHPYAEAAGELAGGLVPFLPALKGEATALKLGAIGGGYGFASGSGREGSPTERLISGTVGAGQGVVTTVLATKALEAAAPLVAKGWQWVRGKDGPVLAPPEGRGNTAEDAGAPEVSSARPAPVEAPAGTVSDVEPAAMFKPGGMAMDSQAVAQRPQPMNQPVTEAQMQARAQDVAPSDVLPVPSNAIADVSEAAAKDAGRYVPAKLVDERTEQQLQDGPVYVDRSVPAGEPQPFAPPEAYEEWPAGGPDFAGNINLAKLDTPQDIKRALAATEQRVGFDAATRGRVTQAETERLAADLGMTPNRLLSRRNGQAFNAEEALAARQILAKSGNELVNMAKRVKALDEPGDDLLAEFRQAWVRHAALQEQVAGATAEAGRALAQFKMLASSKAVRGDVLSAMIGAGGGRDRIKGAAETLIEAAESGPGVFNALVEKASKPRFRDKFNELWINWLLSSPATHVVNMTSNTLTAIGQLPEHGIAAGIGGARRLAGRGDDAVTASEVGVRTFALLQGAKEGARLFAQSLRTGEPSDLVSKVEGIGMKAISGAKGEVVRIPTRFLTAEDELFKGIARRMEINGLAVRMARSEGLKGEARKARIAELSQYPTDDMLARSMEYARYVTFQRKLGPVASKVSAITQDVPGLKLFLPFVRTPTNLLKYAAERSPLAPLLKEWRHDFAAGGARRDLAVAKAMVGTGMGMAIYQAAQQGLISGAAPSDPSRARLMYADGFQPYSVRVGDKWISYRRLDPFSSTLGVAADMALLPEGMSDRQKDDKATLLVASIMGNLANKTWLSGISDVLSAISDPEQNADNLVQRLAGSLAVPTGVAQLARTMDPVQRKVETVGEAIQARVPGLSRDLMPRRDVWGRAVTSEGGIGPDIASPAYESTIENDPVNQALLKAGVSIGLPQRKVGGVELSDEDYDRYQAEAGQRAYARVKAYVSSEAWQRMDDEARQETVSKLVSGARKEARANLAGGGADDPWGSFPAAQSNKQDKWASFPKPEQPDVLGELQRAIPGASFTSGFRTPEYQADMKRRGYSPAHNSGHLDGSSLDIVPPAGKSIGWLAGQVKRVRPNARVLPEGDHLHVTFPDWFGAPVIGGAKAAGLVNPNGQSGATSSAR
ncbi:MAG: thermonuclease family protein [Pseudomonadota bacterium]